MSSVPERGEGGGRRLIVQQFGVSLDGFSAVEEGGEGWPRWGELVDPDLDAHIVDCVRRVGTHIMGRHTYLGHAEYWPRASDSPDPTERTIADLLNGGSKVVFSRSLTQVAWPGTRIAGGETAEEVAELKSEPGDEILAVGGVSFLRSLVRQQLFDSIRLFVLPYVAGRGPSIFSALEQPVSLRLASTRAFPSGVLELVYDRSS